MAPKEMQLQSASSIVITLSVIRYGACRPASAPQLSVDFSAKCPLLFCLRIHFLLSDLIRISAALVAASIFFGPVTDVLPLLGGGRHRRSDSCRNSLAFELSNALRSFIACARYRKDLCKSSFCAARASDTASEAVE